MAVHPTTIRSIANGLTLPSLDLCRGLEYLDRLRGSSSNTSNHTASEKDIHIYMSAFIYYVPRMLEWTSRFTSLPRYPQQKNCKFTDYKAKVP